MPLVKKYKQCGLEPEFEEKLDIMFKRVVATSEMRFAGIRDDFPAEQLTTDEEVRSINQREMGESSSPSKRPRLGRRTKEKNNFVKTSFDRLIDAFEAPPPAPLPDSAILECIGALTHILEVVANM